MNNYERYMDGKTYNINESFSEGIKWYKNNSVCLAAQNINTTPNILHISKNIPVFGWDEILNNALNKLFVKQFPEISLEKIKHPIERGVIVKIKKNINNCFLPCNNGYVIEFNYNSMNELKNEFNNKLMAIKIKYKQSIKTMNIESDSKVNLDLKTIIDTPHLFLYKLLQNNIKIFPFTSLSEFDNSHFYIFIVNKFIFSSHSNILKTSFQ